MVRNEWNIVLIDSDDERDVRGNIDGNAGGTRIAYHDDMSSMSSAPTNLICYDSYQAAYMITIYRRHTVGTRQTTGVTTYTLKTEKLKGHLDG
jgi:hypothetical protein